MIGENRNHGPESIETIKLVISEEHRYQDGPWWHSPARPSEVFLAKDPSTGQYEHIVSFIEWGAHEPWPNARGSAALMPKHSGDDVSFLPKKVRFIGPVSKPVPSEAPFMFFNGLWGDPPSLVFHKSCFYVSGWEHNVLEIPSDDFIDRDPFREGDLFWTPPTTPEGIRLKTLVNCSGSRDDAQVAIRWGHPDFHENEFFPMIVIPRNKEAQKIFKPTRKSEFEIQTEGGANTGYFIRINRLNEDGSEVPIIISERNHGPVKNKHQVVGPVQARRSAGVNSYGEQNIRIDLSSSDSLGEIK